ncbi:MAG: lanthionine synthetase LanC family protein [Acidimicrobiales bacterium]
MPSEIVSVEELIDGGLAWLLAAGRRVDDGLVWAETAAGDQPDFSLYAGSAGIVVTLLEGHRHTKRQEAGDAALQGARAIAAAIGTMENASLYGGLTGCAFALHAVDTILGDSACGQAALRALDIVRSKFDGERWAEEFELLFGNAGVALGALAISRRSGAGQRFLAALNISKFGLSAFILIP